VGEPVSASWFWLSSLRGPRADAPRNDGVCGARRGVGASALASQFAVAQAGAAALFHAPHLALVGGEELGLGFAALFDGPGRWMGGIAFARWFKVS